MRSNKEKMRPANQRIREDLVDLVTALTETCNAPAPKLQVKINSAPGQGTVPAGRQWRPHGSPPLGGGP